MTAQQTISQLSALVCAVAVSYYILNIRDSNTLLVARCHYHHLLGMSDEHFKDNFGFDRIEFEQIHTALRLPPIIQTDVLDSEDSRTALLMLLGYLRGRSLRGLESQYGWSASRISRVRSVISDLILHQWDHLLDVRNCKDTVLSSQNLQRYAQQIQSRCGVDLIWGFVDGTLRPVAHPTHNQEAVYNGT